MTSACEDVVELASAVDYPKSLRNSKNISCASPCANSGSAILEEITLGSLQLLALAPVLGEQRQQSTWRSHLALGIITSCILAPTRARSSVVRLVTLRHALRRCHWTSGFVKHMHHSFNQCTVLAVNYLFTFVGRHQRRYRERNPSRTVLQSCA
jgi:hypothetical protein